MREDWMLRFIVDLWEGMGLDWDELPDIIPDDLTDSEEFKQYLMSHLASKGITAELLG